MTVAMQTIEQGGGQVHRTQRLSEQLWNIRWQELLPQRITQDGVTAVASSMERSAQFIAANYAEIFEEDPSSPFASGKICGAKARYYQAVGDFIEFVHEGRTVGLLIGTPIDWSSYYIRSAASLRAYQGKKIIQRFFPTLFAALKAAGVERVEADTSPSNMATMHLLTRMRFNVTGTVLTERWGAHVHFTHFLDEDAERIFLGQFCTGVKYQLREREGAAFASAE